MKIGKAIISTTIYILINLLIFGKESRVLTISLWILALVFSFICIVDAACEIAEKLEERHEKQEDFERRLATLERDRQSIEERRKKK